MQPPKYCTVVRKPSYIKPTMTYGKLHTLRSPADSNRRVGVPGWFEERLLNGGFWVLGVRTARHMRVKYSPDKVRTTTDSLHSRANSGL